MSMWKAVREAEFEQDAATVLEAFAEAVLEVGGMRLHDREPGTGMIRASTGLSALSYGERVEVLVRPTGDGRSRATVASALKFGLVDWGRNRRNVQRLLEAAGVVLARAAARPDGEVGPLAGAPEALPPPPPPPAT